MPKESPTAKERWMGHILEHELPVFNTTAQKVVSVIGNEKASVAELTEVVLQDQALVARMLRMANSVGFHPGGAPVTSVARAILIMGFLHVHNLVLEVGVVEATLTGTALTNVQRLMTRAYHAASQARRIAIARHDNDPDEIFIVSLLYRIGELAFWCHAGETATELQRRIAQENGRSADAEYDVLGFRLYQLNADLAKAWQLHPLLTEVTQRVIRPDTRNYAIILGWRLAELAELGWESERMQTHVERVADYLRLRQHDVKLLLYATARHAVPIVNGYVQAAATPFLPDPPGLREALVGYI